METELKRETNKESQLKKKKKVCHSLLKDEEEKNLEDIVFGTEDDIIEKLKKKQIQKKRKKEIKYKRPAIIKKKRPAWIDHDVDKSKPLVTTGIQTPKWAERKSIKDNLEDDSDEEILRHAGNLIQKSSILQKGILEIQKCTDLNYEFKQNAVVKSTEFNPSVQVAMVAGFSGTVTLFQVDGKTNSKIQSVHFERFPIHTAHFTTNGEQIVVGSKEFGFFYYYDMIAGKTVKIPMEKGLVQNNVCRFQMSPDGKFIVIYGRFGNIHFLNAQTKEWIFTLKMNGEIYALTFNKDGSRMFSHGDSGQIFIWDMNNRQCIHKFCDEGCLIGTALTVSPNDKYLVAGSDSGVANVYNTTDLLSSSNPKPLKSIMNLTTEVTGLKFNCTSELLAMTSLYKDNAVKLVHFPTITTFSNFPKKEYSLKHPNCLDISLNSGFLSIGNNTGMAYLYRLKHYHNY